MFNQLPEGGFQLTAGRARIEGNNSETLAYIGGKIVANDNASVLDKQHAYWAGAAVKKSVVLINDFRTKQPYSFSWQAKQGNTVIASGTKSGTIGIAQNLFFPVAFNAPSATLKARAASR
jgi:hypothetical protein